MDPSRRSPAIVAALLAGVLLLPPAVAAQTAPFAFLIQDGWHQLLQNPDVRADQVLISWGARAPFYAVANGQKGAQQGTATLAAWSRIVTDPAYAAFGPLGGLITLDFGAFRAHLSLVDTSAGLQGTIGIVGSGGSTQFDVVGTWALGNGTSAGGTADDMVVAGLVRFGTPLAVGTLPIGINPIFPTIPFANDPSPFDTAVSSAANVRLGSFYGVTQYGPVRTYSRILDLTGVVRDAANQMVVSLPGGSYGVLACSELRDHPHDAQGGFVSCSISGLGPLLAPLSGRLSGWSIGITSVFNWQLYQVP